MRSGPVIAGVILLIFGLAVFMYTYNQMVNFQNTGLIGQFARALSPDIQRQYNELQLLQVGGMGFAVAGVGSLIYGAAKK